MPYYPACTASSPVVSTSSGALPALSGSDSAGAVSLDSASLSLSTTLTAPSLACDALPGGASLPWSSPPYAAAPGSPAASSAAAVGSLTAANQSIVCASPARFLQYTNATPAAPGGRCGSLAPPMPAGAPFVSRALSDGAAFTAHPPIAAGSAYFPGQPAALPLLTHSQCVPGDAGAALAAMSAGAHSTNAFYTLYVDLVANGAAGRCNAATAINVTTEVFRA